MKREGKIWIDGMQNVLAGETLPATDIREWLGDRHSVDVLPDVWVLKIGGQSIMDRGGEAVHPILEELRAAKLYNAVSQAFADRVPDNKLPDLFAGIVKAYILVARFETEGIDLRGLREYPKRLQIIRR